jgi:flagellar FliL protein
MKKIIILILALLVLVGAGAAAYFMFVAKPAHENEAEHKEPEKKVRTGPPVFATIGPMIVPVMGETKATQNIIITVSLEVDDDATRDSVRAQSPRLVDAYVQALYGALDTGQVINGQILNIPAIKDELKQVTDKVLGPDVVHDVLIQSVSQRPAY